jgi:hypothetical protein
MGLLGYRPATPSTVDPKPPAAAIHAARPGPLIVRVNRGVAIKNSRPSGERLMVSIQTRLTLASQRAAGQRSFQILRDHDLPRLEAFFLSFDFDQRRGYFGGGVSSQSIRKFCRSIDWNVTRIIARSGPYCLEAIAALVSLPPDYTAIELSVACPLACEQQPIIAELFELAIEIGAFGNRKRCT